jgi:hypothetical protein
MLDSDLKYPKIGYLILGVLNEKNIEASLAHSLSCNVGGMRINTKLSKSAH